jgi:hypothetical protein
VSIELEERFDAVTSTPIPGAESPLRSSGEREPLILAPRGSSDLIAAAAMSDLHPVIPMRPVTEPEIEVVRPRAPTAPEIETVIEFEAEPGEDDEPPPIELVSKEPVVRVTETDDARIVETIQDTSSQTLTLTVTEETDGLQTSAPPIHRAPSNGEAKKQI